MGLSSVLGLVVLLLVSSYFFENVLDLGEV